jgi:hypothetical protein
MGLLEDVLSRKDEPEEVGALDQATIDLKKAQADALNRKGRGGGAPSLDAQIKQARLAKLKAEAAAAGGKATDKAAATTVRMDDNLRKEFNALPSVKAFNEVQISYDKMKAAAAAPTPAGDLTLIYSFMKMQDPGSTVRESEFATAARSGDYGDQVRAMVESVATGQRLSPSQRADFLAQAENFYAAQRAAFDREAARYGDIASKRGGASPATVAPSDSGVTRAEGSLDAASIEW